MVNFPTCIPNCDSHNLTLLDFFLSSDASICSTMLSLHWEILIMLLSQFPLTFHHIHKGMPRFIALLMTIIVLIGTVFCDHLRGVPWEDIFKLSASPAANEFCQWVQVGIDVYIPHRMSQVKLHSSPWFPAACTATIVQKSLFSFVPKG